MSADRLTVGVPREIKPCEKRVGLTPEGVRQLIRAGVPVVVEKKAGEGSGFSDRDYQQAGAQVVGRARDVYRKSGLIKKVKEPLPEEWEFLHPGLIVFSFLHLASPENCRLVEVLLKQKVLGLGLEAIEKNGETLCLKPMSEIAGTLAAYDAGFFRRYVKVLKGRILYPPRLREKLELLAGSYSEIPAGLPPGKVVIYGGGTAGREAAETAIRMGGEVDLIERKESRREWLKEEFQKFGNRFRVWSPEGNVGEAVKAADVWIGCVHVVGERAPLVLTRDDLAGACGQKPKLIVDIAVDQGGNFPETHSTTYEDPLYLDSLGNQRFGVANIPSLCGRQATEALEKVTLPYTLELARDGKMALRESSELRSGLLTIEGQLANEAVARAHRYPWAGTNLAGIL